MTVQSFIDKLKSKAADDSSLEKEMILSVNEDDIRDYCLHVKDIGCIEYADAIMVLPFAKYDGKININKNEIHSGDTCITEILENLDVIDSLNHQISAILDLLMMTEESVEIQSIKTAAEMCMTMQDELMVEVGKIEEKWRGLKKESDTNA